MEVIANTSVNQQAVPAPAAAGSDPTMWIIIGVAVLAVVVIAFLMGRARRG